MRYLRRQVINRRAPGDSRLVVDITSGVVMGTPVSLLMPKGSTAERPVAVETKNGMIRYNTDLNEVEVYQADTWRSLSYKESTGMIQQNVGLGDDIETLFGPLVPSPPLIVDSSTSWSTNGNVITPGNIWTGANILVIVENVIQLYNTNYNIEVNPIGKPVGAYVSFDTPVPTGKPVTVLHGFDR